MTAASRPVSEGILRAQLCDLLRLFYANGWVTGTGGGICTVLTPDTLLMAPTGVHKERVRPSDLFIVNRKDGTVHRRPAHPALRLTECQSIFRLLVNQAGAGSVMHSHALSAVLAADIARGNDCVIVEGLEMLKGVRGATNADKHPIPVIHNTAREPELLSQIGAVVETGAFSGSFCILVRDHGAYIWGADVWEAKRHAEVYHFLFEAMRARSRYNTKEAKGE